MPSADPTLPIPIEIPWQLASTTQLLEPGPMTAEATLSLYTYVPQRPDLDKAFPTLITNAVVLWTTTYLGDALDALRTGGYPITDEALGYLTRPSTTTSTSTAPTPSTSRPSYAAKDADHSGPPPA
jgi:hypothetical protein